MRTENKSLNQSVNEGATDGKYRKVRPNTTVAPGTGEDITLANRRGLHPYWNYDFIDQETPLLQDLTLLIQHLVQQCL